MARMKRATVEPTRYEIIAYRPTGAVLRAAYVEFREIAWRIGDMRRECREAHGFSPDIRVWKHDAATGTREVTAWYPTA